MINIIVCVIVAIASVFSLTPSVDVVSASSQPITNNVNFTGPTAAGNPFEYCTSIYFTASNNWSYSQNLKDSPYTLGGVSFAGATPYASTRPVLVANFSQPIPNAFNYYLYVHNVIYEHSFAADSTYNINSYIFVGSSGTSYSNKSLFGNIGVQIINGELYYIMLFQLPLTGVTKLEIRGAQVDGNNPVIPFGRLDYLVEPEDSSYTQGYLDGQANANNTVNIDSASYTAGYNAGETVGYDAGYYDGDIDGYNAGYNAGQNSSDSFYNMVISVLDAPVQVFLDTFDFEIFGVNVSSIILSLFTLAVITFIIKLLI